MKQWLVMVAVMLAAGSALAQKQRYSSSQNDAYLYNLTVHVAHARLMGQPSAYLHIDAVIDGKQVELETSAGALIHTGDYKARVVSDDEKKSGWFSKVYELLFSDGTHMAFNEVAESE